MYGKAKQDMRITFNSQRNRWEPGSMGELVLRGHYVELDEEFKHYLDPAPEGPPPVRDVTAEAKAEPVMEDKQTYPNKPKSRRKT